MNHRHTNRRPTHHRTARTPVAALALAVAILAASCATPEPRSVAPPPADGLFILAEVTHGGATDSGTNLPDDTAAAPPRDARSDRARAYFVEVTLDTVRLEPVEWDRATGSWREASAATLYLERTTPREAESARLLVRLGNDAIEVVNKQERVRSAYVRAGSPGAPEVPAP